MSGAFNSWLSLVTFNHICFPLIVNFIIQLICRLNCLAFYHMIRMFITYCMIKCLLIVEDRMVKYTSSHLHCVSLNLWWIFDSSTVVHILCLYQYLPCLQEMPYIYTFCSISFFSVEFWGEGIIFLPS